MGCNYLAVCDLAEGDHSEHALEARLGLAAVLAGTLPLFTLEYPCHSPAERRWFLLYATPLPGRARQAVVTHLNITARKLLEERGAAANQEMSDFLSVVSHGCARPDQHQRVSPTGPAAPPPTADRGGTRASPRAPGAATGSTPAEPGTSGSAHAAAEPVDHRRGGGSPVQSDRLTLHRAPCDLVEIVWEAVEEQLLAWPSRRIELQLPEQAVVIEADRERIGQVVTNYLSNALKYAPADRPIEVSVSREAGQARVQVRDHGPGLYRDQQERIWERFYRLPGAQAEQQIGGNLGLGLYICRRVIQEHGGQTGVESTPGAGATFWFTLPVNLTGAGGQAPNLAPEEAMRRGVSP